MCVWRGEYEAGGKGFQTGIGFPRATWLVLGNLDIRVRCDRVEVQWKRLPNMCLMGLAIYASQS